MHISSQFLLLWVTTAVDAAAVKPRGTSTIPDYFQTTYGPFAGPTQAGSAPFLAQTNPAPIGMHPYVPNTPLVTAVPIIGKGDGAESFKHMGNLSPYMPNPAGFGVEEFSLPPGTNITQMHMVHRHGSRYPTSSASVATLPNRIAELLGNGTRFTGNLDFLNTWEYRLGKEALTGLGRQQLFDSGVLHWFNYGQLYDPSLPLIARTCSQVRMLQSAENFLNGFFGPRYAENVSLEVIIEQTGFKNPLAGDKACTNNNNDRSAGGDWANAQWQEKYLKRATERFRESMTGKPNWTTEDTYLAQTMCPYETVGLGYSPFCSLFTQDEWEGFEYSFALEYYGGNGFGSPTGRAVGVGYVQELVARLQHRYPQSDEGFTSINETLDTNPTTFPLNQSLYLDFSHDTTMFSMLTALGLTQFEDFLPTSGPPEDHQLIVSHIVPFAARFNIEVIKAPRPVRAKRSKDPHASAYDNKGGETTYVHMLINQRTISLGRSIPECGKREDGWCELETFVKAQKDNIAKAKYEDSCFGNYSVPTYGDIKTGAI